MPIDLSLFTAIAEIAGVFVGFGALIGVTRRDEVEPGQLGQIRAVVTVGLVVVVAALVPVGLSRYGLTGRPLWLLSGVVFLLLTWGVMIGSLRRQENRALLFAQTRANPAMAAFFWLALELPIQVPLVLAVIGLSSDLDPAFYTTALIFHLFQAAFVLAQIVYSQASRTGE